MGSTGARPPVTKAPSSFNRPRGPLHFFFFDLLFFNKHRVAIYCHQQRLKQCIVKICFKIFKRIHHQKCLYSCQFRCSSASESKHLSRWWRLEASIHNCWRGKQPETETRNRNRNSKLETRNPNPNPFISSHAFHTYHIITGTRVGGGGLKLL